MVKAFTDWRVLPHGPIEHLAENLWRVQGALPNMSLRRTMTVVRRADGDLVVHNAIALGASAMGEIEAWGKPAYLIVPNGFHRLDAFAYKQRYSGLVVLTPAGARAKVQKVVPTDGTFDDLPPDLPSRSVRLEPLEGVGDQEGVMVVNSGDGVTLVLGDVVFNMDRKRDLFGFLFTTLMGSAPGPRVSRLAKAVLVKERAALRRNLERLAATPGLIRLIVAHEKVAIGGEASAALRQAATYL